jgi:hypothetical protein
VKIQKSGGAISAYRWGREIAVYCEKSGDYNFLKKCINWMIKLRCSKLVMVAMRTGTPPRTILQAIRNMRPLTVNYDVKK